MLKTRWKSKNIGEEIFSNIERFLWLKLKMNQKYQNGPTWPTTHADDISSVSVGRTGTRDPQDSLRLRAYSWRQWRTQEIAYSEGKIGRIAP
jgi:hypothetical protein